MNCLQAKQDSLQARSIYTIWRLHLEVVQMPAMAFCGWDNVIAELVCLLLLVIWAGLSHAVISELVCLLVIWAGLSHAVITELVCLLVFWAGLSHAIITELVCLLVIWLLLLNYYINIHHVTFPRRLSKDECYNWWLTIMWYLHGSRYFLLVWPYLEPCMIPHFVGYYYYYY